MRSEPFSDRNEAGRLLGVALARKLRDRDDIIVLALPRGGVPVAHEVAQALNAPLDVFIVRKLGVPGHEELAMGAIASGGGIGRVPPEAIPSPKKIQERVDARGRSSYFDGRFQDDDPSMKRSLIGRSVIA